MRLSLWTSLSVDFVRVDTYCLRARASQQCDVSATSCDWPARKP